MLILLALLACSAPAPGGGQRSANPSGASPAAGDQVGVWQPFGPELATVLSLARDPDEPNILWAGTHFGGIYMSEDGGLSWSHVPTDFPGDGVLDLAIPASAPETIYAATLNNGAHRSTDGGETWEARNDGLPTTSVRAIAVDPTDPQTVLAGSFAGVFRSTDGGRSWTPTESGEDALPGSAFAFDPVEPGVVYLATTGLGVFRSVDGGASWTPLTQGLGLREVTSLWFDPINEDALFCSATDGVFRLTRGDDTWEDLTFNLPPEARIAQTTRLTGQDGIFAATDQSVFQLSFVPPPGTAADYTDPHEPTDTEIIQQQPEWSLWAPQPARLLAAHPSDELIHLAGMFNNFEVTPDGGETFFPATDGMQNLFVGALAAVDAGDETLVYAGTGNDVRVTAPSFNPGGEPIWAPLIDLQGAIFELTPHPNDPGTLYVGSEGLGVHKTEDFGASWEQTSTGIVPTLITDIDQSVAGDGTIYAGTSSGPYLSRDNGQTWEQFFQQQNPTLVTTVEPDPVAGGWVYYGTGDGRVFRSINEGEFFTPLWQAPPGEGIAQLESAPFREIYAVGTSGAVYTSDDSGENFFLRGAEDIQHPALCVAVNETRPWIAYVGTEFGGVYKTESAAIEWTQVNDGIDTPIVFSMAVDQVDDKVVYAGSVDAIYKSVNGGESWQRHDEGLGEGFVNDIRIDPDEPSRLYAVVGDEGDAPGDAGVYRSDDAGQTWTRISFDDDFEVSGAVHPSATEPGVVFAGSRLEGVFRKDQAGPWTPASDNMTLIILGLAIDPLDPHTIYAGSVSGGVFKSEDGGESWTNMGLRDHVVLHLTIDPHNPNRVYASTSRGPMRTSDGGQTWVHVSQRLAFAFDAASDPSDRQTVYVGGLAGGVFRSDDGGLTWTDAGDGLPVLNVNAIAVDPNTGDVFIGLDQGRAFRSTDRGETWSDIGGGSLDDLQILDLAIDPATGDVFAGTNGGGLYRSVDDGQTWSRVDEGFTGDFVSSIAAQPISPTRSLIFASILNEPESTAMDSTGVIEPAPAVYMSSDRGLTWSDASGNLPTDQVRQLASGSAPMAPIYAATPVGVFRSIDLGQSWTPVSEPAFADGEALSVMVDPEDPQRVYVGTQSGVYVSDDDGAMWTPGQTPEAFGEVAVGALAPGPGGDAYAATQNHGALTTDDAGATWFGGVTSDLAEMVLHAIAVHPDDSDTLYAALQTQGVIKSVDDGVSWSFINEGLGASKMFTIAIDPTDPQRIYATGAEAGAWISEDAGQTWSSLNEGLFNPFVTAFTIDPRDSDVIYSGTEGGGVFRLSR